MGMVDRRRFGDGGHRKSKADLQFAVLKKGLCAGIRQPARKASFLREVAVG